MRAEPRAVHLAELLEMARQQNLDVNERTFHYYVTRGLLPKGTKQPYSGADGRVNYWPVTVLKKLRRILRLKNQGFKLEQIRQALEGGPRPPEPDPSEDWRREVALRYLRLFRAGRAELALGDFGEEPDDALWMKHYHDHQRASLAALIGDEAAGYWTREYFLRISPADAQRFLKQFQAALPARPSSPWLRSARRVRRAVSQHLLGRIEPDAFRHFLSGLIRAYQKAASALETTPDGATGEPARRAVEECLAHLRALRTGDCQDWKGPLDGYLRAVERLQICWEVEERLRLLQ